MAPGVMGDQILKISLAAAVNGDSEARSMLSDTLAKAHTTQKGICCRGCSCFHNTSVLTEASFHVPFTCARCSLSPSRVNGSPFRLVAPRRSYLLPLKFAFHTLLCASPSKNLNVSPSIHNKCHGLRDKLHVLYFCMARYWLSSTCHAHRLSCLLWCASSVDLLCLCDRVHAVLRSVRLFPLQPPRGGPQDEEHDARRRKPRPHHQLPGPQRWVQNKVPVSPIH